MAVFLMFWHNILIPQKVFAEKEESLFAICLLFVCYFFALFRGSLLKNRLHFLPPVPNDFGLPETAFFSLGSKQ